MFSLWVVLCSILAAAIASVTGFGIGSILTPLFTLVMGTKLAVSTVSIPHFIATFVRFLGLSQRLRFGKKAAGFAGAVSGMLGGLVGNQGGICSAALLGFDVSKEAFVATATAVGVVVDLARMPVYLVSDGRSMVFEWRTIGIAMIGVLVGTLLGLRFLRCLPEKSFRRVVSVLILLLGVFMLWKGIQAPTH